MVLPGAVPRRLAIDRGIAQTHAIVNTSMKMLLRDVTFVELAEMLARHAGRSSVPHLVAPEARKRARHIARQNGVWDRLSKTFDPARPIPVIKRSTFRQFQRNGNRTRHQDAVQQRHQQIEMAFMALWLDHPRADVDCLQDLLWAECDEWTWVMAAHEYAPVDLGSAMHAARLAEILHVLGDRLEPEVTQRVGAEIERRVFRNVINYDNHEFWYTARMNWNHVCNGSVIRAALLRIDQPRQLARLIHPLIQNMTYALDGFTDDGGCVEGPGYWGFGFGHFVQAAHALHCRTGGELNLMTSAPKIERICRYPSAVHIEGKYRACFADSGHGAIAPLHALLINAFFDIPELYELCARRDTGEVDGAGTLKIDDMHSLALYRDQRATGHADERDTLLPDLGVARMRGKPGPARMTVIATAGDNGVPHNHNDIGSFIVHQRGRLLLTDPGAPLYNSQTFRAGRYEIIYCRSRGHSVPLINGREQQAGARYRGQISVEGFNAADTKRIVIDMSRAYPRGAVQRLMRSLSLDARRNTLTIEDDYAFARTPRSLEEAFVTFEPVALRRGGREVRIGPARSGATLTARQPGRFTIETIVEKPEHTRPGAPAIQRICFVPEKLAKAMTLGFTLA